MAIDDLTADMKFFVDTGVVAEGYPLSPDPTVKGDVLAAQIKDFTLTADTDTIAYASTTNLDMTSLAGKFRTISLEGNLTFTASNQAAGRTLTLRLIADASTRTLAFPAGWKFVGIKPTTIVASKTGMLSLMFFGTADSDCVAAWGVEA